MGADQQTLLKLYRSLICLKLDYDIFIYRSARKSYLKQLNPILHEDLRQVFGTFRTSPVDSLYAEAHEAPLQLKTGSVKLHKSKVCPFNPTYECILNPKYEQHFEKKKNS